MSTYLVLSAMFHRLCITTHRLYVIYRVTDGDPCAPHPDKQSIDD